MKSISLCLTVLGMVAVSSIANAQNFDVVVGGGSGIDIAITANGDQSAGAMNVKSAGGLLVANPDGANPGFGTRLQLPADTGANQVSYAQLGGKVSFAGGSTVVLDTGYNLAGAADPGADFTFEWGDADNNAATSVSFVPEPSTGLLAVFAGLGMMAARRRRNG